MDNNTKNELLTTLQQSFIEMAELDFGFLDKRCRERRKPNKELQEFHIWADSFAKKLAETEGKTTLESLIEVREQTFYRVELPVIHLYHRYGVDLKIIKDWITEGYIKVISRADKFSNAPNGDYFFSYQLSVCPKYLEEKEEQDNILKKLEETYQEEKEKEEKLNPTWGTYLARLKKIMSSSVSDSTISQLLGMGLALLACADNKGCPGDTPLLGNLVLDGLEEKTNFPGALPTDLDLREVITSNKILKAAQRLFCMPPGALSEDRPHPSNIFNSSELETLLVESQRKIEKKDARIAELEAKLADFGATDTGSKAVRTHAASQARQETVLENWQAAFKIMASVIMQCHAEGAKKRTRAEFAAMCAKHGGKLSTAQLDFLRSCLPGDHVNTDGGPSVQG